MKKIRWIVLTLAMILTVCFSANAASIDQGDLSINIPSLIYSVPFWEGIGPLWENPAQTIGNG